MVNHNAKLEKGQQGKQYAQAIELKLFENLKEILRVLDQLLDRRLVGTFLGLAQALILHRHRNEGAWMSELGSYLVPENAEAGRKRIQKLMYSRKWDSELIPEGLWRRGDQRVAAGEQAGETLLAIWDESVLEKPESLT